MASRGCDRSPGNESPAPRRQAAVRSARGRVPPAALFTPAHVAAALFAGALLAAGTLAAGCSADDRSGRTSFTIGAIPDQDPEKLQRLYGKLASYLEQELDVPVDYEPVTDYAAAVTAFRVGDLDMVWFGGLTGVQARLQVPGAEAVVQRGVDANFHSVFIAGTHTDLNPVDSVDGLAQLESHTFTFGSQISTSGRLMPQHYLAQAGVSLDDFRGEPGFSGSHDRTIKLVESGTYDAGAANAQVWESRVADGGVDTSRVRVIWRTPPYYDYHWVIRPDVAERFGRDFVGRVRQAFLSLSLDDPEDREILELFGARQFIPTSNENYREIEAVGRRIGKIR